MEKGVEHVCHGFDPVWNADSRVLILGTMPSPKSRENGFYYGHPRNRFWKVMAAVLGKPVPETVGEKKSFLLENGIALWDVLSECDIRGASDASIENPVPNDIGSIVGRSRIKKIYATGAAAARLYAGLCEKDTGIPAVRLPSTSPANAACSFETLCEEYGQIAENI